MITSQENSFLSFDKKVEKTEVIGRWTTLIVGIVLLSEIYKLLNISKIQKIIHNRIYPKAMVFPVVMYGCESWTVKKAECRRIDAFEL